MADRFGGSHKTFAGVPAFSISMGKKKRSPWVLVVHPLWDWDEGDGPMEGTILKRAAELAMEDSESVGAPLAWDTFNLERRQVLVREQVKAGA
jgi:hypothetical protein